MTAVRRILIALGALGMGFAVLGALSDTDVKPFGVLIFLAGVLAAHDAILLPFVIGVGAIISRRLRRRRAGTPIRVALIVSAAVTVAALPLVLGYGRSADNPSILPLHYGAGLIEVLAAVWGAALVAVAVRVWRDRRRPTAASAMPPPGSPR